MFLEQVLAMPRLIRNRGNMRRLGARCVDIARIEDERDKEGAENGAIVDANLPGPDPLSSPAQPTAYSKRHETGCGIVARIDEISAYYS